MRNFIKKIILSIGYACLFLFLISVIATIWVDRDNLEIVLKLMFTFFFSALMAFLNNWLFFVEP